MPIPLLGQQVAQDGNGIVAVLLALERPTSSVELILAVAGHEVILRSERKGWCPRDGMDPPHPRGHLTERRRQPLGDW
ncbi:hypothetical protein ASF26_01485 [Methylobacterium sp. Leaf93]|nr:hypothetical protein ASF26_01485 [Methylobacterium sp. Leaf93]